MKVELKGAVGIEVASDGSIVDRKEILQRGLLVVGRKLLEEERSGGKREWGAIEQRAIAVARAAEQPTTESEPEQPAVPPTEEQPAVPAVDDPMIEIHRARQRMEELM